MSFVLDNSVVLGWCMPDERTPELMALLDTARRTKLFVPAVWPLEFANALRSNYKKRRIDRPAVSAAFSLIQALDFVVAPAWLPESGDANFDLMLRHDLTSYDLSYLNLAVELAMPMATLDAKLASSAKAAGVACLL